MLYELRFLSTTNMTPDTFMKSNMSDTIKLGQLLLLKECYMSEKSWQTLKVQYCHHADEEVGLEAELVFPPEILPDQPPRILAHRCSHGLACNLDGRPSCIWAGTNPAYDPFISKE